MSDLQSTQTVMSSSDPFEGITFVGDDVVVPFQVDGLGVRGRTIQLGDLLNSILSRHDYPDPVSALLAEMITLTILLGSSLKFQGKFTVQTQSDGPVSLLVVDFATPDAVRAYARFDREKLTLAINDGMTTPEQLMGKGILAMTVDQGPEMQRYQGIVELNATSLEEVARQYFRQSEQIPTEISLAAAQIYTPFTNREGSQHRWRGGGLLLQFLPEGSQFIAHSQHHGETLDNPGSEEFEDNEDWDINESLSDEDAWDEARALVATIADDELTDPQISSERLLFRLFNQHGVRVFEGVEVKDKCSCSRERILELLRSLNREEIAGAPGEEEIITSCEFCSAEYRIRCDEI